MKVEGKRKFVAFLVTMAMFFIITSFVIFSIDVMDSPVITALGAFCGYLGAALMVISGAFYVGNFGEHWTKKNETNN